MDANFMAFGLGSRTCIGKNISLLEMNKLVPVIVRDYDLEIPQESRPRMKTSNHWFVKPVDFRVLVRRRVGVEVGGEKVSS
jgi:cytochrome P450